MCGDWSRPQLWGAPGRFRAAASSAVSARWTMTSPAAASNAGIAASSTASPTSVEVDAPVRVAVTDCSSASDSADRCASTRLARSAS